MLLGKLFRINKIKDCKKHKDSNFLESFGQYCEDSNNNCHDWITSYASLCQTTEYIIKACPKSCGFCVKKFESSMNNFQNILFSLFLK